MSESKKEMLQEKVSKAKTKIKKIIKIICVAAISFVLGFMTCFLRFKQVQKMDDIKITTDNVTIISRQIEKALESASDLVTAKYTYQAVESYESSKWIKGIEVPFTKNKVVYVYDGVVKAAVDLSKVTFEITDKEDEKKIIINLPAVHIESSEIDEKSFEFPYESYSALNKPNMADYVELIDILEENKKKEMENDVEFLTEARNNAKNVLSGMIKSLEITEEYELIFK